MLVSTNKYIAHAEDIYDQMAEEPQLELFHDPNHPLGDYGQCGVCKNCAAQPLFGLADDETINSQYCYQCMLQVDYYLTQLQKEAEETEDVPDSDAVLRADYNRQQVRFY